MHDSKKAHASKNASRIESPGARLEDLFEALSRLPVRQLAAARPRLLVRQTHQPEDQAQLMKLRTALAPHRHTHQARECSNAPRPHRTNPFRLKNTKPELAFGNWEAGIDEALHEVRRRLSEGVRLRKRSAKEESHQKTEKDSFFCSSSTWKKELEPPGLVPHFHTIAYPRSGPQPILWNDSKAPSVPGPAPSLLEDGASQKHLGEDAATAPKVDGTAVGPADRVGGVGGSCRFLVPFPVGKRPDVLERRCDGCF